MTDQLWADECEAVCKRYETGEITREDAAKRLADLGFDHDEVDGWLAVAAGMEP